MCLTRLSSTRRPTSKWLCWPAKTTDQGHPATGQPRDLGCWLVSLLSYVFFILSGLFQGSYPNLCCPVLCDWFFVKYLSSLVIFLLVTHYLSPSCLLFALLSPIHNFYMTDVTSAAVSLRFLITSNQPIIFDSELSFHRHICLHHISLLISFYQHWNSYEFGCQGVHSLMFSWCVSVGEYSRVPTGSKKC